MTCPVCSAPGDASDRFCRRCGCILTFPCANCGRTLRAGDQFCGNCGTPLNAPGAAPAVQHTLSVGAAAEQPRGGISGLEIVGERKVVTVMFADIVGSTQLIEGLDPEQSMRLLEPVLQLMYTAVRRYHGTINRIQGDGIMALFGAPFADEDHAVQACLAALSLSKGARVLADRGIQIRVGLNSGPVVVRSIPNDHSMNYDAIGPTVHLAARMEQSCQPGSVRLTGNTYHLAAHAISARPLGPLSVKGLKAEVETYELIEAASPRKRSDRAPRLHRSRFVGRAPELSALRQSMELCAVGFGQVVSIVGSAGIGKTRLVLEFARRLPESWQQLTCGGTPYDQSSSYHPLRLLLRTWCDISETDDEVESVAKIRRAVSALDYDIGAEFAPLCTLLDLPANDSGWRSTDPALRQRRIATAFVNLILAIARPRPLALIVEDLHWIDAETQAVLGELARGIGLKKILLICAYRPESRGLWSSTADQRRIEVQSLERPHARLLVDNLLGIDVGLDRLKHLIIERSGGIPLFIEEMANALIEAGDLEQAENGYRLRHPINLIRIPDSLHTLIASRIDRIGGRLKHTLQLASVVGYEVPTSLVADMLAEAPEQIAAELRQLEGADFLRQAGPGSDPVFVFKHALIRDVAYESLLSDQRRALHCAAIAALEAHPAALPDDQVERLAHHALSGELWAKAVEYCRKAAEKAYEYSALNDAIRFLEQALTALDRLSRTAEMVGLSVDLRVQLRQALWSVGRVAEANAHLDEAERLAETLDDKTRIAALGVIKTQILNSEGDLEGAVATGRRARSVAQMVGSEPLAIAAEFFLSQSYFFRGELRQAIAVLEPLRARITGKLRRERLGTSMTTSVLCLVNQARVYALLGDFPQARASAAEAEAIAREVDRPFDLGFALHALGNIAVDTGDYEGARRILEQALELCRMHEFQPLFPLVACPLGLALACLGDVKRGTELLADATLIAKRSRLTFYAVWSAAFAARTHLETRALDMALGVANAALPKAIEMNFRFLEIWLRRVAGAATTDADAALAHLQRAAALATELGARPDLAHCRWALAELYDWLGRHDEGEAERIAASELYRALDMHRRFGVASAASRATGERAP